MDKKMKFGLPLVAVMLLGLVGMVSAATITCSVVDDATLSGIDQIGCSVTYSTAEGNFTNMTVEESLANTLNWVLVGRNSTTDASGNLSAQTTNMSIPTSGKKDIDAWDFKITFSNVSSEATPGNSSLIIQDIIIDNTQPVVDSCTLNSVTAANGTVGSSTNNIACTIYNASALNLYWKSNSANSITSASTTTGSTFSCTDWTAADTSQGTAASTGDVVNCVLHGANDAAGVWYFDASDGVDTSTGAHYQVVSEGVFAPDDGDADEETQQQIAAFSTNKKKKIIYAVAIIAMVFIFFLMYAAVKYGKKK